MILQKINEIYEQYGRFIIFHTPDMEIKFDDIFVIKFMGILMFLTYYAQVDPIDIISFCGVLLFNIMIAFCTAVSYKYMILIIILFIIPAIILFGIITLIVLIPYMLCYKFE